MDMNKLDNNNKLIEKMVQGLRPRPWWKRPIIHSWIWIGLNLTIIFSFIDMKNFSGSANQYLFTIIILLFWGINWKFFFKNLNPILDVNEQFSFTRRKVFYSFFLVSLFIGLFIHGFILNDISHTRNWIPYQGEVDCFFHTLKMALFPILLFPFFFQQYFVIQRRRAVLLYTMSIFLLGLMAMNINCLNLDFVHLIWGHYSTIFGLGILVLMSLFIFKKKTFLKI